MVETGEMSEAAMKEASMMPWMEYEVAGVVDFEGLEEAKEFLVTPKKRRLDAGIDVMLTSQAPTAEKKKQRAKRRVERLRERKAGVQESLAEMQKMTEEGMMRGRTG